MVGMFVLCVVLVVGCVSGGMGWVFELDMLFIV